MLRRLVTIVIALLLAVPAAASASPEQIYDDCQDNGRLDRKYSEKDYREAQEGIPADLDEYTNCRDLIRAGLSGVDTTGGSSGGGATGGGGGGGTSPPSGLPEGNGVGSVPLDGKGKPLDPLVDAEDQERSDVASARAGDAIRPTSNGARPGEPDGELPVPLIAVLVIAGIAALAGAAITAKNLVTGRTA